MQNHYRSLMAATLACLVTVSSYAYTIKVTNYTEQETWVAIYRHDMTTNQLNHISSSRHLHGNGQTVALKNVQQNYGAIQFELYAASSLDALKPRLNAASLPRNVAFIANVGTNDTHFFIHELTPDITFIPPFVEPIEPVVLPVIVEPLPGETVLEEPANTVSEESVTQESEAAAPESVVEASN